MRRSVPTLVVRIVAAVAIELVVIRLVMGAAVNMSPVAVFAVVQDAGAAAR